MAVAVFVFDADGSRCAGSPGVDDAFGGSRIGRMSDLASRFRTPDGMPLELDVPGTRVAVGVNGQSGARVAITTDVVSDSVLDGCVPSTIVTVRPFTGDDDPVTVQQALGSILAHELRTPMTTIFGGAQLVSDPRVSKETRAEAAQSVVREAEHLNRIIEDLVDLVRPQGQESDAEPLMLQHVVPAVVASQRAARPQNPITEILPSTLPPVLASQEQLARVLRTLLDHAASSSPPGTPIELEARHDDTVVFIRVADDGPSRDDSDADGAFDLFHASPRTAGDASGANLALVVARRLVTRMGGRIWASSGSRGGEVTFSLPAVQLSD